MALGLKNPLKPKNMVKKPASTPSYTLIALMMFWKTRDAEGKPVGFINSIREGFALGKKRGQDAARKAIEGIKSLFDRGDSEADIAMGKRVAAWDKAGENEKDIGLSDAFAPVTQPGQQHSGTDRAVGRTGAEALNGEILPDDIPSRPASKGVGSDYVGPERQVPHRTDPWPVAGPKRRNASASNALPSPDMVAANDDTLRPGEAAAMRAAARARQMVQEGKIGPSRKTGTNVVKYTPKGVDMEL